MRKWRILARHKWVSGAVITESIFEDDSTRRYTATIRGWRNWKIWEGETAYKPMQPRIDAIIAKVKEIRDRIDSGDETIFNEL